jgi:hypothetical protein
MRLLLMDSLRRRIWFYVTASLYFVAASSTNRFASVGLGLGIGAMLSSAVGSREVLYLPVSRTQIWRTRWILALIPVVLAALIRPLSLGITMAISNQPSDNFSRFLPSTAFQLIYIGSLFAAYIPISRYLTKFASPGRRLLLNAALVLAAIILGAVIEEKLPKQWHALTSGTIFMLVVGISLTVISFFHIPRIVPRRVTSMASFGERSERSSSSGKADLKTRYMRAGLAGPKLLAWRQFCAVLFGAIACGTASQLPILIGGRWGAQGSWLEHVTIFSDPIPIGAAGSFVVAVFFAAIWILMAPDLLGLRSLRVLPVATPTLAAMLTLIPALFWLTFWSFPLATYWILAGHLPSTFRLELLAALTGLTCLATSAGLQAWVKGPAQFVVLPLLSSAGFIAIHFYGKPLGSTVTALIGISGLAGIAVSFVLNDRALRQNSSVYISKLRPRGLARPIWIV